MLRVLKDEGEETAFAYVKKRLKEAAGELKSSSGYDYIVVNDVAEQATQRVLTLLEAERYRAKRNGYLIDKILGQNS